MPVHEQEAPEALTVERFEQIPKHCDEGLHPERWAPGEGSEGRRQPVGQHRQDRNPKRLGGIDRRPLREDVVGLEREVGVLLGRPDGQHDPVVAREVLLDLHPVELADPHQISSSDARRRPSTSKIRRRTYARTA